MDSEMQVREPNLVSFAGAVWRAEEGCGLVLSGCLRRLERAVGVGCGMVWWQRARADVTGIEAGVDGKDSFSLGRNHNSCRRSQG